MSIENGINAADFIISDVSNVHNMRANIYKTKLELIKTPLLQEILHAVLPDPQYPPSKITVNQDCIIAKFRDAETNTYHPTGTVVYTPEVTFDYYFCSALCLIIQDMYPGMFDMPTITMSQLTEMIQSESWYTTLKLKPQLEHIALVRAFSIEDLATKPLESLPIELKDPKAKKISKIPTIALIFSILTIFSAVIPGLGTLFGIPGIVLSIIGISTNTKKKQCVISLLLSIFGAFILSSIIAFIGFKSMF